MSIRKGLLAVDIDGTLLTDHGDITDSVRKALARASEAGWEIALASGRTFPAAKGIAAEFPFVRYAAVSNGASIMDVHNEKVVHIETLSSDMVKWAVGVLREQGAIPALYDSDQFNQHVYYDTLENACEFFEWYVTHDSRCVKIDDVTAYTGDVLQIGTIARRDIIFRSRDIIRGNGVFAVALPFESETIGGKNHDFWFLQVVNESATKHNALLRLCDMLNIPAGRLVAVGDNYNDAEMIRHADVGVAMGNAPDEIKDIADLVVSPNSRSGLSEVVERVLLSGEHFPETD